MKVLWQWFVSSLVVLSLIACDGDENSTPDEGTSVPGSGAVNWQFNVGSDTYVYYASPALSEDEQTIYVGTSRKVMSNPSRQDALVAVSKDGSQLWRYELSGGEEIRSTPVVYNDKIYFTANYRTGTYSKSYADLFSINQDGSLAWRQRISDAPGTYGNGLSKVVAVQGKIISIMQLGLVFDAESGDLLHSFDPCMGCATIDDHLINPAVDQMYNVVFAFFGRLYQFNVETYQLVSHEIDNLLNTVLSTPAIDSMGYIYFGTEGGKLFSVTPDGQTRWIYQASNFDVHSGPYIRSSAAIDEVNRLLYVGTKGNEKSKMLAISLDTGELVWEYATAKDIYNAPLITDNYKIYFASEAQRVHILNTQGQEESSILLNGDVTWSSPALDSQGNLYIGTMGNGEGNGLLFSIKTDSTGLLDGPWSKIHKNNQNTGF